MARKRGVPVPHGALKRERQLVTTTPTLDIDELTALQLTERDRSRSPPVASATRERDGRDRRATALELLPHSLASRQLATPGAQPSRMRLGSLTTRRRVASVARHRLAGRARALSPTPRDVHPLSGTRALARRIPILSTARARRRPAVRAPLIQPYAAVAHPASPPRAGEPGVVLHAGSVAPRRLPNRTASDRIRAPPKSSRNVQVGRCCLLNWASKRRFADLLAQKNLCLLPAHESESARFPGLLDDGETRTRTGDTTIFSRVLYQLSYLAVAARC